MIALYIFQEGFIKNISNCRKEPPAGRVVALLVEEFETLMDGRPGFVEDSGSDVSCMKLNLYSAFQWGNDTWIYIKF